MTPELLKLYERYKALAKKAPVGVIMDIGSMVEQNDISFDEAQMILEYLQNDEDIIMKHSYICCWYGK